jgi:hypothetical protein
MGELRSLALLTSTFRSRRLFKGWRWSLLAAGRRGSCFIASALALLLLPALNFVTDIYAFYIDQNVGLFSAGLFVSTFVLWITLLITGLIGTAYRWTRISRTCTAMIAISVAISAIYIRRLDELSDAVFFRIHERHFKSAVDEQSPGKPTTIVFRAINGAFIKTIVWISDLAAIEEKASPQRRIQRWGKDFELFAGCDWFVRKRFGEKFYLVSISCSAF